MLGAAAAVLKTDEEFSAAIALSFRIDLVNMFFAGDLYAGTGVVVDPKHPPKVSDSLEETAANTAQQAVLGVFHQSIRTLLFEAAARIRPAASLIADNRLDIIGDAIAQQSRLLRADQQRRSDSRQAGTRVAAGNAGLQDRRLRSWRPSRQYRRAAAGVRHAGHAGRAMDGSGAMKLGIGSFCLAVALGGCASQSVSIRSVPPETRRRKMRRAARKRGGLRGRGGCRHLETRREADAARSPRRPGAADMRAAGDPGRRAVHGDLRPLGRLNRFTYRFNARFDEAVFLPVANAYRRMPSPIRSGVHNFFGNLAEVDSVINYSLQWRLKLGVRSLGRFVINSTIGIGGLIDVAAKLKLPRAPTGCQHDVGQVGHASGSVSGHSASRSVHVAGRARAFSPTTVPRTPSMSRNCIAAMCPGASGA